MRDAALEVAPGECVGLVGPVGRGQVHADADGLWQLPCRWGSIRVGGLDVTQAAPREIIALRRETLGYVSQFLRVVPRVPTLEVVAEPLLATGRAPEVARTGRATCWRG
jgi:alpha-D-ribose 1-methylphosphonate 5-triphosphate synthase subunit PhnL